MGLVDVIESLRFMGAGSVLRWLWHRVQLKTGHYRRRLPTRPWDAIPASEIFRPETPPDPAGYAAFRRDNAPAFFFPPGRLPARCDQLLGLGPDATERTIRTADAFCQGRFLYFSDAVGDLGWPVNWHRNPFTGTTAGPGVHWSEGGNFSPALGDIKFIWEPSRFAAAYWLARAAWLGGAGPYGQRFWELVESWAQANPPQLGANWQSGQETGLRAMALAFGAYAFADHPSATPDRLILLARMMSEHGRRIEAFIGHAVRQKTNHSLSESAGLMTVGLLYPELRAAPRWAERGRRILDAELARQLYDDGSYVQQSMNYHRLMLQTCCWALRLGELSGRPMGDDFRRRVAQAAEFLFQMLDPLSGRAPNYGANDGALVLPLDSCDYLDYRPAVQLAAALATGGRWLGDGPWNEPLAWLADGEALSPERHQPRRPASSRFPAGGYFTLRDGDDWCMVRCHSYRDRVGHVDMLHADFWHAGLNVLRDGGSYSYFAPTEPAMERHFASLAAHNTVRIDGREPLRRASRFLWLPWPRARVLAAGQPGAWEGEHYAYGRAPWRCVHRRRIERLAPGRWRWTDTISGAGRRRIELRWRMPDLPFELDESAGLLTMALPDGAMTLRVRVDASRVVEAVRLEAVRGRESGEPCGWESLYYGRRQPAVVLVATLAADLPASLRTEVRLPGA